MAKKISQMTEATEIKTDDISVVVQEGETKQFPLNLLATKAQADEYKTGVETQLADYEQEITDIKNQYDKELYSPTITVTNTSIVKTGQGDTLDYSASVEDGVAKSAILKGCTLVNILTKPITNHTFTTGMANTQNTTQLQANKKYIAFIDIANVTNEATGIYIRIHNTIPNGNALVLPIKDEKFTVGLHKLIFTMPSSSYNEFEIMIGFVRNAEATVTYNYAMVIEYQDGMENWDIPYFEGMQSVKMPVLTTTGKNLIGNLVHGNVGSNGVILDDKGQKRVRTDYIPISSTGAYILSNHSDEIGITIIFTFDENKNLIKNRGWNASHFNSQHTFSNEEKYIIIEMTHDLSNQIDIDLSKIKIQFEQNIQVTTYEPYKTNILSTPSDLELRGIGNVQDTLDLLTGELTHYIKDGLLDGTETWTAVFNSNSSVFSTTSFNIVVGSEIIYDKLPDGVNNITNNNGVLKVSTTSAFASISVSNFIKKLKENPIPFMYCSNDVVIKTVVLNPSGTLASETPYMWKNGSIQLSSDGLVPCLDYAVTTSRVGVIETNMSETIVNEKRIHALEVILAQSTITAAADAVSLQSDLETTTMSVDGAQLDTGNTQDDFLYEMILLLIEKDAYDESLFDKVCAFYLYGKLSDEQFTNIYSLLYVEDGE